MRVIITGGGTGGHIYPALSIAEGLKKEFKNPEILYIGTKTGLEADVVPRAGYSIEFVHSEGLSRKLSFKLVKTMAKTFYGVGQALNIIRKFKPDVVIGTGGFVAGPVMLAAILLRKKTMIHEQNAFPSLTNRLVSKHVDQIALSFAEADQYLKGNQMVHTGNPIRKEILNRSREEGYRNLQLDPSKKTIFVVGGSGGATSLNNAMLDFYEYIQEHQELQLVHVTGKRDYLKQMQAIKDRNISLSSRVHVEDYLYAIQDAYAVADLMICRSGAMTLAEATARGIPMVLIPFPFSAEDHQVHNARSLEKAGAAKMILDGELDGEHLTSMIDEIFSTRGMIDKMRQASLKMGRPDADQQIVQLVRDLL